jgi:hypothetical protein
LIQERVRIFRAEINAKKIKEDRRGGSTLKGFERNIERRMSNDEGKALVGSCVDLKCYLSLIFFWCEDAEERLAENIRVLYFSCISQRVFSPPAAVKIRRDH